MKENPNPEPCWELCVYAWTVALTKAEENPREAPGRPRWSVCDRQNGKSMLPATSAEPQPKIGRGGRISLDSKIGGEKRVQLGDPACSWRARALRSGRGSTLSEVQRKVDQTTQACLVKLITEHLRGARDTEKEKGTILVQRERQQKLSLKNSDTKTDH